MFRQSLVFDIEGMTCGACVNDVQRALGKLDGVGAVVVALKSGTAAMHIDPHRVTPVQIEQAIDRLGFRARARPAPCTEH